MSDNVSLHLNDLLKIHKIDPKEVLLIRHAKSDEGFKNCYDKHFVLEYTSIQKDKMPTKYKYWIVFISNKGTKAKYYGIFEVLGYTSVKNKTVPFGFPYPDWFNRESYLYFDLKEINVLSDFKNRLVIEWGGATRSWYQKADINNKAVLSIYDSEFKGYDKTILPFNILEDIVNNPSAHEGYITALENIKAVYLISDKATGKQYVGSAYNENGCLLGRWTDYINTKHGGNKLIKQYLKKNPDGYRTFQFSILQIFSGEAKKDDIIKRENLYKDKLLTRDFGWNDN